MMCMRRISYYILLIDPILLFYYKNPEYLVSKYYTIVSIYTGLTTHFLWKP